MRIASVLTVAATALATLIPATAQTAPTEIQLVSANTELTQTLDAKNLKQGDAVTAKVRATIRFANGTEIARGSQLLGHVETITGATQVVLTFDKAQLKGGKQLPIKATITAIIPAGTQDYLAETPSATTKIQSVGQDVNLKSAVQGSDSGQLTGKKSIHLPVGTQLEFAIAAPTAAANTANGN
jgi:hypothetical protein